jgi:hypothetical protein
MEYSFFAPLKIHNVLKDQAKGARIKLAKIAVEKNKKLIQDYSIEILSPSKTNQNNTPPPDNKQPETTDLPHSPRISTPSLLPDPHFSFRLRALYFNQLADSNSSQIL